MSTSGGGRLGKPGHGRTKLPLLRTLSVSGYPLLYPRKLAKRLKQSGELSAEQMRLVAEALAHAFQPA